MPNNNAQIFHTNAVLIETLRSAANIIRPNDPLSLPNDTIKDRTKLHKAVINFRFKEVEKLSEVPGQINQQDSFGMTALHYAVSKESSNNFPIIKNLLKNNADITIANKKRHTVFHMATARNDSQLLQLLLNPDQSHTKQHINQYGKELVSLALQ